MTKIKTRTMTIGAITAILTVSILMVNSPLIAAHVDSDADAIFALVIGGSNAEGNIADHEYADIATSQADTVAFTPPGSIAGGFFDAVEADFQDDGLPVPTAEATFDLYFLGFLVADNLSALKGFEEADFTFDTLSPNTFYFVEVVIDDMDNDGLTFDQLGTEPAVETVFVSGNGLELGSAAADSGVLGAQTITQMLPLIAQSDGAGEIVVGFNEVFVWDDDDLPSAPGIGSQAGIRVEQITLDARTGTLDKVIDNCDDIPIKETSETVCTFRITYSGNSALILDTVPAEWKINSITNSGADDCTWDADGANKKGNKKSATKIECDAANGDVDALVEIETRKSPSGKLKFKPTSCGDFELNSGAVALLTEGGEVVLTGELIPAVLDTTDPLMVQAIASSSFDCED